MKLYKQPRSNKWFFDHTFPDGKRLRRSTNSTDKSVAKIRANIAVREIEEKEGTILKRGEFWNEYLAYSKARKSPRTVKGEEQYWKRFTAFIGRNDPAHIELETAERFITHLLSGGSKPATVNGYHRILKLILNKALQWNYTAANPFMKIKMQTYEADLPRYLTQKEINNFFEHAWRLYPAHVPLFQFYLLTGTRRNEAISLTWDDIDFSAGIIIIRKHGARATKGKRARVIPMLPLTKKILQSRRKLLRPFEFNADGTTQIYSKIAKAAKIANTSLHDLRRSFATYLAPDMEQSALMKILGHADFRVTDVYYLGSNSGEMKKRMSKLEKMLKKSNPTK